MDLRIMLLVVSLIGFAISPLGQDIIKSTSGTESVSPTDMIGGMVETATKPMNFPIWLLVLVIGLVLVFK